MKNPPPLKKTNRSLTRRLVAAIILFSSFITILTTGAQLMFDYEQGISSIESDIDRIETTHLKSIANSIWVFNEEQIKIQLDGLLAIQDVEYLRIDASGGNIWSVGTKSAKNNLIKTFPLTFKFRNQNIAVGALVVSASIDNLFQRLLDKLVIILVGNGIKTFLVAGFMFAVFHFFVIRHLRELTDFFRNRPVFEELPEFHFSGARTSSNTTDELDELVDAYNDLRHRLTDVMTALRSSEGKFKQLFEDAKVGMALVTPAGRIRETNASLAELLDYERGELEQKQIVDIFNSDLSADARDAMSKSTRGWNQNEIRLLDKGGKSIWGLMSIAPVFDDQRNLQYSIYQFQDLTPTKIAEENIRSANDQLELHVAERTKQLRAEIEERKVTEQKLKTAMLIAEEASRAKSDFLANMSHELRTPLNAIIGFSATLDAEIFGALANDKQTEYIKFILESGNHLLELINDILDVAAIESGRFELHETVVEIGSVVNAALKMVENQADTDHIQITNEVAADLPPIIGDERRLKQALVNLLSNAIKYTPNGGKVNILSSTKPDGSLSITVRDTGVGMDESQIKIALEQFSRLNNIEADEIEGTGLGLPLTKSLIEAHGGELIISSQPGLGTNVDITIPKERVSG